MTFLFLKEEERNTRVVVVIERMLFVMPLVQTSNQKALIELRDKRNGLLAGLMKLSNWHKAKVYSPSFSMGSRKNRNEQNF